jgi:hypothetical protein
LFLKGKQNFFAKRKEVIDKDSIGYPKAQYKISLILTGGGVLHVSCISITLPHNIHAACCSAGSIPSGSDDSHVQSKQ